MQQGEPSAQFNDQHVLMDLISAAEIAFLIQSTKEWLDEQKKKSPECCMKKLNLNKLKC